MGRKKMSKLSDNFIKCFVSMLWLTQLSQSKMSFILVHKLYMTVLADRWLASNDFICDELIE